MKELSDGQLGGFERVQVHLWDTVFYASLVLHLLAELSACSTPAPERCQSRSSGAGEYWLRLLTFLASSSQRRVQGWKRAHTSSRLVARTGCFCGQYGNFQVNYSLRSWHHVGYVCPHISPLLHGRDEQQQCRAWEPLAHLTPPPRLTLNTECRAGRQWVLFL